MLLRNLDQETADGSVSRVTYDQGLPEAAGGSAAKLLCSHCLPIFLGMCRAKTLEAVASNGRLPKRPPSGIRLSLGVDPYWQSSHFRCSALTAHIDFGWIGWIGRGVHPRRVVAKALCRA